MADKKEEENLPESRPSTSEPKKEGNQKEKKVILHAEAYKTIILYASRYANNSIPKEWWKEIYGVLIGYMTDDAVIVERAEPITKGEATDVDLSVEHYTHIEEINDKLYNEEGSDKFLVGWFHSHPGLGLFYSFIDIKNQIGFQGPNIHSIGLVFDHTYLIGENRKPNHPGFEIYRLNDPTMDIGDPKFDTNYHEVEYEIVGLNEFFFANVLTELSGYVTIGEVLQKSYEESKEFSVKQSKQKKNQQKIIKNEAKAIMNELSASDSTHIRNVEKELELEKIPSASDVKKQENDERDTKLIEAEKKIFEGKTAFLIEDSFSAIENYNAALEILKSEGDRYFEKVLEIFHEILDNCMKFDHDNLVIEYAEKLKNEAEKVGNMFYMGNADFFKGKVMMKKQNIDEGLRILQNTSILFEKALDYAGVGEVNRVIADQYLKVKNYDSASLFYIEAIKNYTKAIVKFHPKRKSIWALPQNLKKSIEDLKNLVQKIGAEIEDGELLKKLTDELKSLE